jgi:predicted Zn finger-like uncharacterized protein
MSLITRCPACGTMFNVVTDQLKVSQGWVRCGQCADVFDATLHLQNEVAAPVPEVPQVSNAGALPAATATATVSAVSSSTSYAEEVSAALKTPDAQAVAPVTGTAAVASPQARQPTDEPEPIDERDDISSEVPSEVASSVVDDVSFVRDARRQAFWRKPWVRVGLIFSALLLISLLTLQVAVAQRDNLAAREPRLRPGLQWMCEHLACQVGPVRQIEAIVIDSSSFNKVNDAGTYRLSFALKNTGAAAVAMPSLEVTLTDTQDQAVLRRVLSPVQFGAANSMLAASSEFSGALSLQVAASPTPPEPASAPSPASRVAGYRLLAFYP